MALEPLWVGVIALDGISPIYLSAIWRSPAMDLYRVASRSAARVTRYTAQFGIAGSDIAALRADDLIEKVVNLTPAVAHDEVNATIIVAGKHVYSEQPLALAEKVAS